MKTIFAVLVTLASGARATSFSASVQALSGTSSLSGPVAKQQRTSPDPVRLNAVSAVQEQSGEIATGSGVALAKASVAPGAVQLFVDAAGRAGIVARGQMVAKSQSSSSGSVDDAFVVLSSACPNPPLCATGRTGALTFSARLGGKAGGAGEYAWSPGDVGVLERQRCLAGRHSPRCRLYRGRSAADIDALDGQPVPLGRVLPGSDQLRQRLVGHADIHRQLPFWHADLAPPRRFDAGPGDGALGRQRRGRTASAGAGFSSNMLDNDPYHATARGGIPGVRDEAGKVLAQFTALSGATGFDNRQAVNCPVPEVPLSALWVAGLAGVGCCVGASRARGARHSRLCNAQGTPIAFDDGDGDGDGDHAGGDTAVHAGIGAKTDRRATDFLTTALPL